MRLVYGTLAMVGLASLGSSLLGACSNDAGNCDLTNSCSSGASGSSSTSSSSGSSGAGGSSSSSSSTSSSSGGGAGGGIPSTCVPSDADNKFTAVSSSCGVFVSSSLGDDNNDGSRDKPLKTLQHAIASAGNRPIYACGETFTQTVTLGGKLTIYGGLDCVGNGWIYDANKKTELTTVAGAVPLTLTGAAVGAEVFDFAVTAADALVLGDSSIAVVAENATATFTRCEFSAGKGLDGEPGAPQNPMPQGLNGKPGVDSMTPCTSSQALPGGTNPIQTCGGTDVTGGDGGPGKPGSIGGAGSPGAPAGAMGLGGKGQDTMSCDAGGKGADGKPGTSGTGAAGIGDISVMGYAPTLATDGISPGTPGQGGGGGGGAKACASPPAPMNVAGAPGGAGGSGGCGGAPGKAGGSAGSSIGLVSIGSTLTLTNLKITSNAGAAGGTGGDGQPGGDGGQPGTAVGSACFGGKGGKGGNGGSGGGGLGGHSLGIAFKGNAPTQNNVTFTVGAFGLGGIGGDMDMTAGVVGENGKSCKTLSFDDKTCTM